MYNYSCCIFKLYCLFYSKNNEKNVNLLIIMEKIYLNNLNIEKHKSIEKINRNDFFYQIRNIFLTKNTFEVCIIQENIFFP